MLFSSVSDMPTPCTHSHLSWFSLVAGKKGAPLPPVDLLPAATFSLFLFPENLLVRFCYVDGCHFFPPPSLSSTHLYLALIPIIPQKCPCPCHLSRCQTQGPVLCLLLTSQQHDLSAPNTVFLDLLNPCGCSFSSPSVPSLLTLCYLTAGWQFPRASF